jgi:hypothetical protein
MLLKMINRWNSKGKETYALGIQILTVLSFDADARTSPSGENFTSVTTPFGNIDGLRRE